MHFFHSMMSLLPLDADGRKLKRWSVLNWHDFQTKFHVNPSTAAKLNWGEGTTGTGALLIILSLQ
jgi:hypothetical protein